MTKQSRYIQKDLDKAKPYEAKAKLYNVLSLILASVTLAVTIIFGAVSPNKLLVVAIFLAGLFAYFFLLKLGIKANAKSSVSNTKYLQEMINEQEYTDAEIDEFDRIIDDIERNDYTFEADGLKITFSPDIMVIMSEYGYIETCRVSDIRRVIYYGTEGEYSFDFDGIRGNFFSIDVAATSKERVLDYISRYYPQFELVETTYEELKKRDNEEHS